MLYVGEETVKLEESCWDRLAVYACKEQWAPFAELLDSTYRARSSQDRSTLQTLLFYPCISPFLSLPREAMSAWRLPQKARGMPLCAARW